MEHYRYATVLSNMGNGFHTYPQAVREAEVILCDTHHFQSGPDTKHALSSRCGMSPLGPLERH